MSLKEFLEYFHTSLDTIYDHKEVKSFFYMLLEHHLNIDRLQMALNPNQIVNHDDLVVLKEALQKLQDHIPIQYVIGATNFYGLNFKVNEHTLIPRPETEELVSWIIDDLKKHDTSNPKILDIGTGSGCIAIAIKKHFPEAEVFAFDRSAEALKVTEENAKINHVDINFFQNDILHFEYSKLISEAYQFDIIVSNPPYVREKEKSLMQSNVLDHEPHSALFVKDDDPLKFYRAICEFSLDHLISSGKLYFEINEYLGEEMIALMKAFKFKSIQLKKDLFGKNRMILGVKN